MKHPSAYYLLLLYIVAVCKPLLPVVSDVLAHTFWETKHLAAVHNHQGKNHLHDELKEAARQDAADSNASCGKTSELVSIHLLTHYHFDFSHRVIMLQKPFVGSYAIANALLEKPSPPPKA